MVARWASLCNYNSNLTSPTSIYILYYILAICICDLFGIILPIRVDIVRFVILTVR